MILNETSYFGAGCRETIAVEAARRGFKKAFFVTDRDLIRFKVADKVIEVFEKNSILYELFSDVKANPTITNVQNGVAAFKASGADFIVALGGGSSSTSTGTSFWACFPLHAAKNAIAATAIKYFFITIIYFISDVWTYNIKSPTICFVRDHF